MTTSHFASYVPIVHIPPAAGWFTGERFVAWFRVYGREFLTLSAPASAGSTLLSCLPIRAPIAANSRIHFQAQNLTIRVSGAALPGDTTLSVTSLYGPLPASATGFKLVDLTGMTLAWVVEKPDNVALFTAIAPTLVDDPADSYLASPIKIAEVVIPSATTAALVAGTYLHRFRRTDAGLERTLLQGNATLRSR